MQIDHFEAMHIRFLLLSLYLCLYPPNVDVQAIVALDHTKWYTHTHTR